jgi:hypothetical protein
VGSLDDAIREHLELKRRLGASDDEIKQKETEAFGKGNRPAPPEPDPAAEAPAADLEAGDESFIDHDLSAAEPGANGQPSTAEWDAADLSSSRGTRDDDDLFEPDEVPPEESLTVRDARRRREELAASEPLDEEDVLEETPEFLEETPEQDRLWFEQRPPKDFDLD